MHSHKVDTKKRSLIGLGVVGAALPSTWSKPLVSAVLTPAHAMTSICPVIQFGNVLISQTSGGNLPCQISFEIQSADSPTTELTNVMVSSDVMVPDMVTTDGSTDTAVVVTWVGGGICSPGQASVAINVEFTVTASCANGPDPAPLVFNLTDLPGVSPLV